MENVKVIVTDGNESSVESRLNLINSIFVILYSTGRDFTGLHKGR